MHQLKIFPPVIVKTPIFKPKGENIMKECHSTVVVLAVASLSAVVSLTGRAPAGEPPQQMIAAAG